MERTNKIILVTGATGRQGGVTTRHLLAGGWKVRALTRDASAPSAPWPLGLRHLVEEDREGHTRGMGTKQRTGYAMRQAPSPHR